VCLVLNEPAILTQKKNFKLNCKKKQVREKQVPKLQRFKKVLPCHLEKLEGSRKVIYGGGAGVSEVCMFYWSVHSFSPLFSDSGK